jgi:hypothetical protein
MSRARHKSGGEVNFGKAKVDNDPKPANRGASSNVSKEADKRKSGGRAGRKSGGGVKHLEKTEDLKHAKHVGQIKGSRDTCAARAPRKSGGRAGSPFSAAHAGEAPKGHKTKNID